MNYEHDLLLVTIYMHAAEQIVNIIFFSIASSNFMLSLGYPSQK
jgi:hypothetical protein